MIARFWKIAVVVAIAVPGIALRWSGTPLDPIPSIAAYGAGVVAASFLLAWAAEAAQIDVSASVATAVLALIAILPEYAIDLYFGFRAGHDAAYGPYAAANMTGSNRLLVGVGWPMVTLLFVVRARREGRTAKRAPAVAMRLAPRRSIDVAFLGAASIYAFVIPLRGRLTLVDSAVLMALFALYLWRVAGEPREEPELHGVAKDLGDLPTAGRRSAVLALFAAAAVIVAQSAKPFADSLVSGGRQLGIDEFLLVQWLAPLASEAPELLVAGILALRGDFDTALGTLLSSKVNQWTLLVGSLPIAFSLGGGHGGLALDARQNGEFFLTAAQAAMASVLLTPLSLGPREALALFVLFTAQLVSPGRGARTVFALAYLAIAAVLLIVRRRDVVRVTRRTFQRSA